jgi:Fic family protein
LPKKPLNLQNEGTQTNMEEAFLSKEEIAYEKRDDWEEVQNYISAMNEAVKLLHRLPFHPDLKQTHKILLQGVRGEHKLPGEYRTSKTTGLAEPVLVTQPLFLPFTLVLMSSFRILKYLQTMKYHHFLI